MTRLLSRGRPRTSVQGTAVTSEPDAPPTRPSPLSVTPVLSVVAIGAGPVAAWRSLDLGVIATVAKTSNSVGECTAKEAA